MQKYSEHFKTLEEGQSVRLQLQSLQELDFLKFSLDSSVRDKFFMGFSNGCKENSAVVEELCTLRRDYAVVASKQPSFFDFQKQRNLIKIRGDLRSKIEQIRKVIQPHAHRDQEIIRHITGETDIRYQDMAHLKEKLRALLLAKDPNNIQMLACFQLKNVLNGLTLFLSDAFDEKFKVRTIVLDIETAQLIDEKQGHESSMFALDFLQNPKYKDCPILFEIDIQGKGVIILDLFQRP